MNEFQKITVGISVHPRTGTPDVGSMRAARQAAWVAGRTGARVTLLTAAWSEDMSCPIELSSTAMDELSQLAILVAADGARVDIEVVEDYPWLALVRRGLTGEADIIFAGKRGASDRGRRRVGSTAIKLLRKCPAPVWLVKPDHDLTHRHVLAATDLSAVSERAVSAASWITARSEGELHVLHAWGLKPSEARAAACLGEESYAALMDSARAKAQTALEHEVAALDVDPTLHLLKGSAHVELLKMAEEEHPDLLVMGSLSSGGRPGFHVGTIAERVIEQVDESILTFKPKDFVCPVTDGELQGTAAGGSASD